MERVFSEAGTIDPSIPGVEVRAQARAEPWWRSTLAVTVLGTLVAAIAPTTAAIHGGYTRLKELGLAEAQQAKELALAREQKGKELALAREQRDKDLALVQQEHSHKVLIDLLDRVIDPDNDPEVREALLRFLAQYPGGPFQKWATGELERVKPVVERIVRLRTEARDKEASVGKMGADLQARSEQLRALRRSRDPRARAEAAKARVALTELVKKQKAAGAEARRLQAQLHAAKNPSAAIRRIPRPRAWKGLLESAGPRSLRIGR